MDTHLSRRNVVLVLIGIAVLLIKPWFRDSLGGLVHAYLGNLAASFAVFFLVAIGASLKLSRIGVAVVALLVVEAFELTNGFGVMTNVYDPFDYLANLFGIVLAFSVDLMTARTLKTGTQSV